MKQYLDTMQQILDQGSWQENRTGTRTKMIPGAMMQFKMEDGFPAMTTKKLAFGAVKGELIGFLRGCTSAAEFRELGCKIWDQNANEDGINPQGKVIPNPWLKNPARKGEDDLGYIYSRLWTDMPHSLVTEQWDQIQKLIEGIKNDPTSRRLIVSAWHPEVFDRAALPPCHVLFQVIIEQSTKKMHMTMYQRSCDFFLGVPFNIASYSLLLHMLAAFTGYKAGTFTWFGADVHIYEDHLEQVKEQLGRKPLGLPSLCRVDDIPDTIEDWEPNQWILSDYEYHPPIKAPMAV